MNARRAVLAIIALMLAAMPSACRPPYAMEFPEGFKRYERSRDFRLISADGVRLAAREVDNYPEATLEFWTDALSLHLEEQGYAHKHRECFETTAGLPGCTLEVMLPRGAEDWVLSTTLFVEGDRIYLVEAAASFERFAPVEDRLRAALATFDPGR